MSGAAKPAAPAVRQFTVDADDDGVRLDRWFKRHLPQVGFGTVSKWARTGQLRVDGKRVKPEDRLSGPPAERTPAANPSRSASSPLRKSPRPRPW